MAINEDESKLVAIFVQSCLWGAFAVMFLLTYWTLVYRRPLGRPINWPMLLVSILMFMLATMQLAVNFTRIVRGFVMNAGHTGEYFNELAEFTQVFGSALYIVQTFLGDGVAIYRCYIVWSRRSIYILVPFVTYIGSIVTGIGILITMGESTTGSLVFINELGHWISSFFALTLTTSTTFPVMIASRIWYLNSQSTRDHSRRKGSLHPIARVVVESGAIYSGLLVALLILYAQESWFQYVVVDALSSLIGIVFSVIIVRIGLGIAIDPDTVQGSMSGKTLGGSSTRPNSVAVNTMSSSGTKTLAKLTSLSTQTLSLLLERQRLQSFPSASLNPSSQPKNQHAVQITKNLQQLRAGILDMEEQDGRTEAVVLLRGQYDRMRSMLGENTDGINIQSLDLPAPQPTTSTASSSTDSLTRAPSPQMVLPPTPPGNGSTEFNYTPYKDDPDTDPPLDDAGLLLQQRMMMTEQDDHLDRLSQSINRQHHISLQINDELEVHSGLLEELDTDIDRTHSRLSGARRRLDRVAQGAKENSSAVAIGVIILILLILIIIFKT
ncbi:hypothetical protein NP233_g705 [Leucocoprinus birnbaumii]|uniref:t-SNARE coiled-coil homology domain-containing protein n=1 Tax=Leucocoprinus birnbaumii TaxID=56174 RepID=A0AAD5W3D8_9AGAR|nr:hypothetical protein NP233_g705 [Leucocoprinus birnbaumii]